ncbi:hypothetical protein ACFQ60_46305 [Streptomyces zhihengii]
MALLLQLGRPQVAAVEGMDEHDRTVLDQRRHDRVVVAVHRDRAADHQIRHRRAFLGVHEGNPLSVE